MQFILMFIHLISFKFEQTQSSMKNLLFLLIPLFVFSQQRDPRSDQFNFVPGELIVKLKDDVDAVDIVRLNVFNVWVVF